MHQSERQFVHDSIIEEYLEAAEDGEIENACGESFPWLILTVGVKGSGKQHAIRELVEAGHLPLKSFVLVDQDALRRCLPEFEWYLEHAPEMVIDMTRKEAGYIAETLCLAGLRMSKTVLWDSSLHNVDWYIHRIQELRKTFPHLKVALIHVTATEAEIKARCAKESDLTGRTIPPSEISRAIDQLPGKVDKIKDEVEFDFVCQVKNNDDVIEVTGDDDFQVFADDSTPCVADQTMGRLSIVSIDGGKDADEELSLRRLSYRVSRDVMGLEEMPKPKRVNKRTGRRRFSYMQSSEENHKSEEMVREDTVVVSNRQLFAF